MKLNEEILYRLAKHWPKPNAFKNRELGGKYDKLEYHLNYALHRQYLSSAKRGVNFEFYSKTILDIGCGHGGGTIFLGVVGAKKVVGIDLNYLHLEYANEFLKIQQNRLGIPLPVEFLEMNAYNMSFKENSFDLIIVDSGFEHFMKPDKVLEQSYKVLRPGGNLIVPMFSSILSKYGLHLKFGFNIPWLNLLFSEKTIINVLYRFAEENPDLFLIYPGLKDKPENIRDVRRYKDLNDITYSKFKLMAAEAGFKLESFQTLTPRDMRFIAAMIRRVPFVKNSKLTDIFSTGARAVLQK